MALKENLGNPKIGIEDLFFYQLTSVNLKVPFSNLRNSLFYDDAIKTRPEKNFHGTGPETAREIISDVQPKLVFQQFSSSLEDLAGWL